MKEKKKKICTDCKKEKPLDEFPLQYYTPGKHTVGDGHRGECKTCHSKKVRRIYHKRTTPEERKAYMRNYMKTYRRKLKKVTA